MRKMRCLFLAALLAVTAAVAVPAMAASSPADPGLWVSWWQELSVWIERLSPFSDKAVAASSDPTPTVGEDDTPAAPDDHPSFTDVVPAGEPSNDTGPGMDPNG